jgi:hypothetical protein
MKYTKVDEHNKEQQKGLNMQMNRPSLKKMLLSSVHVRGLKS